MTTDSRLAALPPLFAELQKVLLGDVLCSQEDLITWSTDMSEVIIKPRAVVLPKSVRDIKHVLAFAKEHGMPISVSGNNQGTGGGALSSGIVICMHRYLNSVSSVDIHNHTVTAEAGALVEHIRERLHGWGMDIPVFTNKEHTCTIGGAVSTNISTAATATHGDVGSWVKSMTVLLDNGEEHHIADGIAPSGRLLEIYMSLFPLLQHHTKAIQKFQEEHIHTTSGFNVWNQAIGPRQLMDIFIGSEGTLGILTSITLRTSPQKPMSISCAAYVDANTVEVATKLYKQHYTDELFLVDTSLVSYADPTTVTALAPIMEEKEASRYILVGTQIGTNEHTIKLLQKELMHSLREHTIPSHSCAELELHSLSRVASHAREILALYGQNYLTPIMTYESCTIPEERISAYIQSIETYFKAEGIIGSIQGYPGSRHVSVIFLHDRQGDTTGVKLHTIQDYIHSCITQHKGSVTGGNGDGVTRTDYAKLHFSQPLQTLFGELRRICDPHALFAPAKKGYSTSTAKYQLRAH
jgi:FAD/FMN-containing dehydrogenase